MFAKSVAEFLETSGFGIIDETIFIDAFPSRSEVPDSICVYNTHGYAIKGRARNSVDFTCQIRVRNDLNSKASEISLLIYNELEKGFIYDNSGKRFTIRPLNPPVFLKFDEGNRANWILNVTGLALNY